MQAWGLADKPRIHQCIQIKSWNCTSNLGDANQTIHLLQVKFDSIQMWNIFFLVFFQFCILENLLSVVVIVVLLSFSIFIFSTIFLLIYRTMPEITQFCAGIDTISCLCQVLKSNPKAWSRQQSEKCGGRHNIFMGNFPENIEGTN